MSRRRAAADDRPSHFLETRKAGGKRDPERVTSVGRALWELEIRMTTAYLRQARRRSEWNFGTCHGHLPRELRPRGIGTPEAAKRFLREEFIAEFNQRFRVPAAQPYSAFLGMRGQYPERNFWMQQERAQDCKNPWEKSSEWSPYSNMEEKG